MKKLLSIILSMVMLLTSMLFGMETVFADTQWQCGDNASAVLENGILTVSGEGDMYDYTLDGAHPQPWRDAEGITNIVIEKGITSVGAFAFAQLLELKRVDIADTVELIGASAFLACTDLEKFVNYSDCRYADTNSVTAASSLVMYGKPGLSTQTYADNSGISFEPLVMLTFAFHRDSGKQAVTQWYMQGTPSGEINIPQNTPVSQTDMGVHYTYSWGVIKDIAQAGVTYSEKRSSSICDWQELKTEPTCTEKGYNGEQCSVCGKISQNTVVTDAHHFLAVREENIIPSTCMNDGSKDIVTYCSVCSEVLDTETVIIEKIGHTPEVIPASDADCLNTGSTEGCRCSVCGVILVASEEIPAKGHSFMDDNPSCLVCGTANPDYKEPTTVPTTEPATQPITESTTVPTTQPTTVPTTQQTAEPTKPTTTVPAAASTIKPAATTAKKQTAPSGAKKVSGEWIYTSTKKKTSVKKIKNAKKSFKLTWKKISSVTGYQIQYSTSKKFTKKTTKSVLVSKVKTTSKSIKKPNAKKKYYVRIRTYKNVKFNGKTVKVYSKWSSVKTIKTK